MGDHFSMLLITAFVINGSLALLAILLHYEALFQLDGYLPKFGIGKDDKTTAARSQAQFESSIDRFNYDRQAYWYMEIAELDRFVFIGASKTRIGEVFIKIIKRGDPLWLSGKEKASALAYYSDVATI